MDKKSREIVMAKLYFKNKDYAMAEKSFKDHLSTNPDDVAALKLLAQVYEQNKRFDKAFEMYERCYLAEPDRTSILLDICRILLLNDVNLQRIDQRKWLDLAIKSYPSNPIVINLKSMLFTLPDKPPMRTEKQIDDPLSKILEKLSLMESRLERIEGQLKNINISASVSNGLTSSAADTSVQTPSPKNEEKPTPVSTPKVKEPATPETQKSASSVKENSSSNFVLGKPLFSADLTQGKNLFADSISKLNISTEGAFSSSTNVKPNSETKSTPEAAKPVNSVKENSPSNFVLGKPLFSADLTQGKNLFADSISKLNINTEGAFCLSTNLKPNNEPKSTLEAAKPANSISENSPSGFVFGKTLSNADLTPGKNLFADSISKLNINTEGAFSTSASDIKPLSTSPSTIKPFAETKAEKEDDEYVPEEELPIENTCDMTPIELKTGEENEDAVFEHRCKLYRLRDAEWKERGLGSIKVLKHKETGKGRLIMRREAIGLVCLNCWDITKITRVRDTQIRWGGVDASEPGPPTLSAFLAKFKTPELTDQFLSILTDLYPDEKKDSSEGRQHDEN